MQGSEATRNGAAQLVLMSKVFNLRHHWQWAALHIFIRMLYHMYSVCIACTQTHATFLSFPPVATSKSIDPAVWCTQDDTFGEPDLSRIMFRDVDTKGHKWWLFPAYFNETASNSDVILTTVGAAHAQTFCAGCQLLCKRLD